MYIPSIYKSVPQLISAVVGANVITAVNRNYSRLSFPGIKNENQSGFVSTSQSCVAITTNTNLQVYVLPFFTTPIKVLIEEFLPLFYSKAFYHNFVTILTQQLSGTLNTGQTYGPKAFVVCNGAYSDFGASPSGLALAEAQVNAELTLDTATGIITATRDEVDYIDAPGTLYVSFTIIDPK